MWSVLDEHRSYLADTHRLTAFERALAAVVPPGSVVVDLGAGTGILGVLALRAGAGRAVAIESSSLLELTRAVYAANGFADRAAFVRGRSTEVELAERADVVVADQLGPFGFEAGLFESFADARRRLLRPSGVAVPRSVAFRAAPVTCPAKVAETDFWLTAPGHVDVSAARRLTANAPSSVDLDPGDLLADPADLGTVATDADVASLSLSGRTMAHRDGPLHGLGGWFEATLAEGVTMSNSPLDPGRIDREQAYLPLDAPVAVRTGDTITIEVDVRFVSRTRRWRVRVERAGEVVATADQSTLGALLLDPEELARSRPDGRPVLSERGRARLVTLALCDGSTRLADIEAEVRRRHPATVGSVEESQAFVAEVLGRDA